MLNNIKTHSHSPVFAPHKDMAWEPISKHPFAVSGEGNLALVGKSKHWTASKSQLCFAQVTHPRGVFINLCQNLGDFGWVPVEIKSWKSCGGALSRLCPCVGCQCVWEGALQTHEKPVEEDVEMWRRRVDLGFEPQPADQRPNPIISSIMHAVLSPLLSQFWMSLFRFRLCQIMRFLRLSWEPSTRNLKAILSMLFSHLLLIANTHAPLFAAAEVKARQFSKELVWKWWMGKSGLGDVQEFLAQSSFIEQQLLHDLHKYFNFSS